MSEMKQVEVLVIPADGKAYAVPFSTLKEYQGAVGGWIEVVATRHGRIFLANEDGRSLGLPVNPVASAMTGRELLGTVLVVGEADEDDEDGNWTDFHPACFDWVERHGGTYDEASADAWSERRNANPYYVKVASIKA